MSPQREVALVLVVLALVLAVLLPVAFPELPRPQAPTVSSMAGDVPPTPAAMPQPYGSPSPAGESSVVSPTAALPPAAATLDPVQLATATAWYGAGQPSAQPTIALATATQGGAGYPALTALPTRTMAPTSTATQEPTEDRGTATATATAGTGTGTATAGTATITATPTQEDGGYP